MNKAKIKALQNITTTQEELFSGIEAGQKLREIADSHQINDATYDKFVQVIGDVILGLSPQERLPELLIKELELSKTETMRITADVLDFLEPLTSSTLKPAADNTTTSAAINTLKVPVTKSNTLADELEAAEAAFHDLQPIRTMAQDMESLKQDIEHLHTATSQDVLLNGDGNGKKNPEAAWDTE
jgi:hypothetical protein